MEQKKILLGKKILEKEAYWKKNHGKKKQSEKENLLRKKKTY